MFVEGFLSYLRYLCLFTYSGVQHILCGGFLSSSCTEIYYEWHNTGYHCDITFLSILNKPFSVSWFSLRGDIDNSHTPQTWTLRKNLIDFIICIIKPTLLHIVYYFYFFSMYKLAFHCTKMTKENNPKICRHYLLN